MKKKLTTFITILLLLIAGFIYIDNALELGIVQKIERQFDNQGPSIQTEDLRAAYLIDSDIDLSNISCEDNVDDTCDVSVIGEIINDEEGTYQVTLYARDQQGNETSYIYEYQIVSHAVGNIPAGYYDGIEGLEGEALKTFLHELIDDHTVYPYTDDDTDVWDILRAADEDPNNSSNVLTFYTGISIPKDCQDGQDNPDGFCQVEAYGELTDVSWNREHIWSKSRGFPTESYDAYTDAHHLVAVEKTMNSTKNNRFFETCDDGDDSNIEARDYGNYTCNLRDFEPRDEIKGDVARMIFYMSVRYEDEVDLEIIDDPMDYLIGLGEDIYSDLPIYGDIDDLLRWHEEDPISEAEARRNDVIYSYQGNRNPFIDYPDLVQLIWGSSDNPIEQN
jgi:endonuclease I